MAPTIPPSVAVRPASGHACDTGPLAPTPRNTKADLLSFPRAFLLLFGVAFPGMDFFIVLERPGKRVARRKKRQSKVGTCHQVTKTDAQKWFQQKYDGIILTK